MRDNIITVTSMREGIINRIGTLYQYDYGQKIVLPTMELPTAYEVHFANSISEKSITMIGDETGVDIPDALLLTGNDIHVWFYFHTGDADGETVYHCFILVKRRAEPDHEEPTPVQQSEIDQLIIALNKAVEESETNVTHYPVIQEGYWYVWDAENEEYVSSGIPATGPQGIQGPIGPTPDISIGTVTTGAAGTDASATMTGTPENPVLNLTIPRGDPGEVTEQELEDALANKADKTDTVLNTTLSMGRTAGVSVGTGSTALGNNVTASGDYSHAEGKNTIASGAESHAEGLSTSASGTYAHAEGAGCFATGAGAHAEGNSSSASGENAHAEGGWMTTASGKNSHAEGSGGIWIDGGDHIQSGAYGESDHSEGYITRAASGSGKGAHAEGRQTQSLGDATHAEGSCTVASGANSHSEGYQTTASGAYSHAEGYGFGRYSVIIDGVQSLTGARAYASHAEGYQTVASGDYSHAEGFKTLAGNRAHTEGENTHAGGRGSHAEGNGSVASGDYSHAEGYYTIANARSMHVQGEYNALPAGGAIHVVGNGASNNARANAYSLDWSGNGHYAGDVYVGCNADSSGGYKLAKVSEIPDISGKLDASEKGSANGVAELDSSGKVPSSQLPSYVDDVLEYATRSAFPETGESGKIYVDLSANLTYRWGGSAYVEISPSLALGETDSTAYRGDRGKVAYDHASAKGSAYESGLYKIVTNSEGHVTGAIVVTLSDLTALGVAAATDIPEFATDAEVQEIIDEWSESA